MTGKKLYRSRTDVKISGVCGGIAEYLGIDCKSVVGIGQLYDRTDVWAAVICYLCVYHPGGFWLY